MIEYCLANTILPNNTHARSETRSPNALGHALFAAHTKNCPNKTPQANQCTCRSCHRFSVAICFKVVHIFSYTLHTRCGWWLPNYSPIHLCLCAYMCVISLRRKVTYLFRIRNVRPFVVRCGRFRRHLNCKCAVAVTIKTHTVNRPAPP